MEDLLPGLGRDLARAGALATSTGEIAWLGEHGWLQYSLGGFPLMSVSRPLLELVVRRRVAAHAGVTTLAGRRAVALRGRPAVGSATPWSVELDDGTSVTAHLVIDASGRRSRLPQWLGDLAATSPPSTTIDIRMGYACREFVAPSQPLPVGVRCGRVSRTTLASPRGGSEGRRPERSRYRGVNTQNSWPSGSAITTQLTSPWPMSIRFAPRETRRSTSAC